MCWCVGWAYRNGARGVSHGVLVEGWERMRVRDLSVDGKGGGVLAGGLVDLRRGVFDCGGAVNVTVCFFCVLMHQCFGRGEWMETSGFCYEEVIRYLAEARRMGCRPCREEALLEGTGKAVNDVRDRSWSIPRILRGACTCSVCKWQSGRAGQD